MFLLSSFSESYYISSPNSFLTVIILFFIKNINNCDNNKKLKLQIPPWSICKGDQVT